jgi:hypothetical protein
MTACTEFLKLDKEDVANKVDELLLIGSVLEITPSSFTMNLPEMLNQYIKENSDAQDKRAEFRAALGFFDKIKLRI